MPEDLAADPPETLVSLFSGFHPVVGCTGFAGGIGTQRKLARAVLEAGVQRYLPRQFGVDYDVIGRGSAQDRFDEPLDVHALLRARNRTGWTIISTGMFTRFLFGPGFGVVDLARNTVHALGSWDNAVTVTTPEDIGALTAEIPFAELPILNQVVYTAADTITCAQLADRVGAVLNRRMQRANGACPSCRLNSRTTRTTPPRSTAWSLQKAGGVAWKREQTFNVQHGTQVMDVEQGTRKHLE